MCPTKHETPLVLSKLLTGPQMVTFRLFRSEKAHESYIISQIKRTLSIKRMTN